MFFVVINMEYISYLLIEKDILLFKCLKIMSSIFNMFNLVFCELINID